MPQKPKVLVLGDHWKALVLAHQFHLSGVEVAVLLSPEPPPRLEISTLGNGEEKATALRIYGQALTDSFWSLSEENLRLASQAFAQWNIPHQVGEVQREEGKGPAAVWSPPELVRQLTEELGETRFLGQGSPSQITGAISGAQVQWPGGEWEGSLVVWASSHGGADLFPWLKDRWIPVTLSTFYIKEDLGPWVLPNGGVDYRYGLGGQTRLGSFRSLHRDDRVGVLAEVDAISQVGVTKGFQVSEAALDWENHVEGVTCDGLPLVGSLPDLPTVFCCGGFNGRGANFWFSVAARLVAGLGKEGAFSGLSFASTRRFI